LPVAPGTRLGVYDVTAQIGEGGMGEVYRATDTKLKRQVAIKILPLSFAADPDRLARFQREAEVLASLNHPHIAAIYGLEDSEGVHALVMELVEGEDLSQRIARGAIPLDEALCIGRQIAEALEAAHEQGIVHRDLKPANIKVRADGTVKVLDFGLAKAVAGSAAGLQSPEGLGQSPTITTPAMTHAGMILGTAAYMSPEQASGTLVDRRADIWAYGVVLWEMLSGQRLFGGDTVAHTLADVLRGPIAFDTLDTPIPIKTLLRRCLDRDAKTRLRDIGEARVALAKYLADPTAATEIPRQSPRLVNRWMALAAAGVLVATAAAGWLRPRPAATSAMPSDLALTIAPPAGSLAPVGDLHATPEISPDGSAVIFYRDIASAGSGGGMQVRRLNSVTPEPVRTGGFRNPGFWSPDSRTFVFSDGTNLKKMRVPDGAPETVASGVATMVGGSWSDNGTLLVTGAGVSLHVVPAAGGVARRVELPLPNGVLFPYWPEFLPGSEDFLLIAPAERPEERESTLPR
jgi:serine/threonine-protein kinase